MQRATRSPNNELSVTGHPPVLAIALQRRRLLRQPQRQWQQRTENGKDDEDNAEWFKHRRCVS